MNNRDLPDVGAYGNTPLRETELGPLPEEWEVVQLKEIARITMGQSPPSSTYNDARNGLPFLQGKAEFGELYPIPVKWCSSPIKVANSGAVLVSVRAPVGDVNVAPWRCCIGRGLAAVEAKDADNDFLFYWLRLSKRLLESKGTGTTFRSINKDALASFPVPLPPLPEQRAIAQVLRTVQQAKEATERVIAAARELKKSLMRHLFTYGPVPVGQVDGVRLKETEIGPVPEGWEVVQFGEIVNKRGESVEPSSHPNLPYVGLEHLEPGQVYIVRWGRADNVRSLKSHFYNGDILYGKLRPYLDKAALAEWDGMCSTDILVFVPNDRSLPRFVAYLVHTKRFIEHAIATTTGVNHPRSSWSALSKLFIPLPPLPEQRAIADILRTVDRKIQAEEQRKAALDALFKTLLHHLMTGKVRVRGAITEPEE